MRKDCNHRGYSLLELLVVIAIIALMVSIMLPAISLAQAQGRKTKCLTNLRTILQTAQAYATSDPMGVLVPVHPNAGKFRGEGFFEYGGGPGKNPYAGWCTTQSEECDVFDPNSRPLNKVMYGLTDFNQTSVSPGNLSYFKEFRCTGDDRGWQHIRGPGGMLEDRGTVESPYYLEYGVSYRANNLSFSSGKIAGVYGRPKTRIPSTSDTVAWMEARAHQTIFNNGLCRYSGPSVALTGYHRRLGHFNLGYADGHAAFADMSPGTHHEPSQSYREIYVRGSWGRMDCLPEPYYEDLLPGAWPNPVRR